MKIWPKTLSNEYKHAEQNLNKTRDICAQSWPCRRQENLTFSLNFWLWRQVPEKWQVTRGFILWLFRSWGIDCQIRNLKAKFGRITSWTFDHPISHCELSRISIQAFTFLLITYSRVVWFENLVLCSTKQFFPTFRRSAQMNLQLDLLVSRHSKFYPNFLHLSNALVL